MQWEIKILTKTSEARIVLYHLMSMMYWMQRRSPVFLEKIWWVSFSWRRCRQHQLWFRRTLLIIFAIIPGWYHICEEQLWRYSEFFYRGALRFGDQWWWRSCWLLHPVQSAGLLPVSENHYDDNCDEEDLITNTHLLLVSCVLLLCKGAKIIIMTHQLHFLLEAGGCVLVGVYLGLFIHIIPGFNLDNVSFDEEFFLIFYSHLLSMRRRSL